MSSSGLRVPRPIRSAVPILLKPGKSFDTLTHERPYKKAFTFGVALEEISSQSGKQFDPAIVDAF